MKTLMPAFGLGKHARPFVTGTIGYAPIGSVLPSVGAIVSLEPVGEVVGNEPQNATSLEPGDLISSLQLSDIGSAEPEDVVSLESFGARAHSEELGFFITEFGSIANTWGTAVGISAFAQSGYAQGDMNVTSVVIRMRNINGATDEVTLDLREFTHIGIPENPPTLPEDMDLVDSVTIDGADIPSDWTYIRFEFPEPVPLPYDWILVLSRSNVNDANYYGIYTNGFGNFPNGTSWAMYLGNWYPGASTDLPLTVNKETFISGMLVSDEPDDLESLQPSGTVSEEPDDIESEEPI